MTLSAALSADAMTAIRMRRDAIARESASDAAVAENRLARERAAAGVRAFTAWFNKRRAAGEIVMSGERMLDVQPALSNRFCLGMFGGRYYLGIPPECNEWFRELPWLHVVIGRAATSLSLVCERSRMPEASFPEFALNFEVGTDAMLRFMANYHYLDVRLISCASKEYEEGGARKIQVGRDVLMTLDIRVVPGERTFTALLDGRIPDGFQNRSIQATPRGSCVEPDLLKTSIFKRKGE